MVTKGVIEEGIQAFSGKRLRVSLGDCAAERLEGMLREIDAEAVRVESELVALESKVRDLYTKSDDVSLQFEAGQYQFPLESHKETLADLRMRLDDLRDKRKMVFNAYQEKVLLDNQAGILGSVMKVKLKNGFIFFLILMVLGLLAIDAGNVGAKGGGAQLKADVEDGVITNVTVVDGGSGYKAAGATPIPEAGQSIGGGAEIILKVNDGGSVTEAIVASGGKNYGTDLRIAVNPWLSPSAQWIFWGVDFLCCLIFMTNFIFELRNADSKKWYWRTHWIDFITSIPLPPAQMLAQIGLGGSESLRAGTTFASGSIAARTPGIAPVPVFMARPGSSRRNFRCPLDEKILLRRVDCPGPRSPHDFDFWRKRRRTRSCQWISAGPLVEFYDPGHRRIWRHLQPGDSLGKVVDRFSGHCRNGVGRRVHSDFDDSTGWQRRTCSGCGSERFSGTNRVRSSSFRRGSHSP